MVKKADFILINIFTTSLNHKFTTMCEKKWDKVYIHPTNPRCQCHVGSGIGFCDNQNGLLQLHSGSTSSVVNWSIATCPECGCQTHYWHQNMRTHHSCASESALASSQVPHNIKTVCTYASGAHRPCSCLPVWHGNGNRRSVRPRKAQIFKHFSIWTSVIEAQVRQEKLLICRT